MRPQNLASQPAPDPLNAQLLPQSFITIAASRRQRNVAISIGIMLIVLFALVIPFAKSPWLMIEPFIPIVVTIVFWSDIITAVLLFSQALVTRRTPIVVLFATYLFSGLMTIPYLFSFPGLFAPLGLFGGNTQTTNWLWIVWHAGFPLGILLYLWLDSRPAPPLASTGRTVALAAISAAAIGLLIVGLSAVAYRFNHFLPTLVINRNYERVISSGIGPVLWLVGLAALIAIIVRTRGQMIVHLWLTIAMIAWLLDVAMTLLSGERFSIGWYIARVNTVFASIAVLLAMLYEINQLYYRLSRKEQELSNALQLRNQFLMLAAHELKTPLTTIAGSAQLLQRTLARHELATERDQRRAEVMVQQVERLNMLIANLLDVSRIHEGRLSLSREQVDLTLLSQRIADEISATLLNHQIILSGVDTPHVIAGDRQRLEQMLHNLLGNAIKYSPEGGTIHLDLAPAGETICLSVSDRGLGIAAADLPHLFDKFYRVPNADYQINGLGIGLSVVREIILLHGGTITVESQPGHGSTFRVFLPYHAPTDDRTALESAVLLAPAPQR